MKNTFRKMLAAMTAGIMLTGGAAMAAESISFEGTVAASDTYEVYAAIGGTVSSVDAEVGQKVAAGSVLATLQSKLLGGAIGVLFGLLGKLGDKNAINAAAAYLGNGVYQMYRHLYRSAGANENYFALDAEDCTLGVADAEMKLEEARYLHALHQQEAQKAEFPNLSAEAVAEAYPGRCQSLTQVLSTADARLNKLSHQ